MSDSLSVLPRIFLEGKGVGTINERIKKAERKVKYVAILNDYLLSICLHYKDAKKILSYNNTFAGICETIKKKKPIAKGFAIKRPIEETDQEGARERIVDIFGYKGFYDVMRVPIMQRKQEDPEKIVAELNELYNAFVYENNILLYKLSFLDIPEVKGFQKFKCLSKI
jgi:hypothetical protein